jgi:hypothetical protein
MSQLIDQFGVTVRVVNAWDKPTDGPETRIDQWGWESTPSATPLSPDVSLHRVSRVK